MPELIRSFVTRLRLFVGIRRSAPRFPTCLRATVRLGEERGNNGPATYVEALEGHTRDISWTGVGLVMPAVRIGDRYFTDAERTLRIGLELPEGAVELKAIAVRYEQLDVDQGFLIGVRISGMSDTDRARFTEHLRKLR